MKAFKKRWIKVVLADMSRFEGLKKNMDQIPGIDDVILDENSSRIHVVYDLEKITYEEIIVTIEKSGVKVHNGFWHRLKRNLFNYTEQNELENLHAPASPCCSNPDKVLNRMR